MIEIFKDKTTGLWAAGRLRFQVKSDLFRWLKKNTQPVVFLDYPL